MKEQPYSCPECRHQMIEHAENYKYDTCGLPGVVLSGVTVARCPNCGEHVVEIPNVAGLHQLLAATVATKSTALTGREIRFLRKWLGWSGTDMARWMSTDPSTVSRWESSKQTMSAGFERALRMVIINDTNAPRASIETLESRVTPLRHARVRPTRKGWVLELAA